VKKHFLTFLGLLLTTVLLECKDPIRNFSAGPGDSQIIGTWQMIERHYPKDSSKSILTVNRTTRRDSVLLVIGGQSIKKDTLITVVDTVYIRRDTTFYKTQYYSNIPSQTLSFDSEGKLKSNGNETTYYRPYTYYRVDRTYPDSLLIDLFIQTNGANYAVRQGLDFKLDTLVIKHRCEQPCYSKFLRVP
jgi:hypothetical protein